MAKLLTNKKEAWAKAHEPEYLRGTALNPNLSDALAYQRRLDKLITLMTDETQKELKKLFKSETATGYFAQDASLSSQARIITNSLIKKFEGLFLSLSGKLAEQVIQEANRSSTSSLHSSLQQLSGGLSLKTSALSQTTLEVMNASIAENVALIKSIPQQYLNGVQQAVMRSITSGQGLADLVPYLEKHKQITKRRAKMIAYDQTRKAYNAINREKMDRLGIKKFEWLHSGGSNHPRKLHQQLSGKVFSIDRPPVIDENGTRGFPGQLPNCFTGSTKVSLANGCRHLWRYFYTGDLITISIGNGDIIESTLNHPILTTRGWLPANEVQESDYLISCDSNDVRIIDNEKTDNVTTFDKLFASFSVTDGYASLPGSEFNFHGDIPKTNVDTIRLDNNLSSRVEVIDSEQVEQFIFAFADILANDSILSFNAEIIQFDFSGLLGKGGSFLGSHLTESDSVGITSISQNNPSLLQQSSNDLSGNIIDSSEGKDALTHIITGNNGINAVVDFLQIGNSRRCVVKPFLESGAQSSSTTAILDRVFSECHTVVKTFLRVQKKSVSVFSGHVYTLESDCGWYNITSANIIVKNCRCRMLPVIDFSTLK